VKDGSRFGLLHPEGGNLYFMLRPFIGATAGFRFRAAHPEFAAFDRDHHRYDHHIRAR